MRSRRITAFLAALLLLLMGTALADAHQHTWREDSRTEPTCTRKGKVTYACACGETKTEDIPALGHDFGKWKTTKEATCEKEGEQTRKCARCGKKETRQTDRLPHTWGAWEITAEATDHSAGTRRHTCKACGHSEEEHFDPEGTLRRGAKGEAVKELQQGLICFGVLTGPADGSFGRGTEQAVKAAQAAEGLTADGVAWPQTLARIGHRFGEWRVVTRPTRAADGMRERTCARCGTIERDVVKAAPLFKRGQRGSGIEFLQTVIGDLGYDPGKKDGVFGPKLDDAFGRWSRDHGWYYVPGLLRPIDIDRVIGEWIELEERIDESEEGSPVQLSLSLTPAFDVSDVRVDQKLTFYWTAVNHGTEDCTLGPVLYSFGEGGDVRKSYRFVSDVDGNLLKANGTNTLTGTLCFIAERDLFEWEKSGIGTLRLNAWALGTSRVTGKKWYSPTVTQRMSCSTESDLVLSVKLLSPKKEAYAVGDELTFRWTLTNRGAQPLTVRSVSATTPDDQCQPTPVKAEVLPPNGVGSVSDTCTVRLYDDWRYHGWQQDRVGQWWFYFEAWAAGDGVDIRANEVDFCLPCERAESDLALSVEQISPEKDAYAAGDEVTFRWTLTNRGTEDLKLDLVAVRARSDAGDAPCEDFCYDPVLLRANGQSSASDTYTLKLKENWIYHGKYPTFDGGWRLCFYAYAVPTKSTDVPWVRSNDADCFLPSRAHEADLLLTVTQTSASKAKYTVGEEVACAWTLTNLGDKDLTLDFVGAQCDDSDGIQVLQSGPARLYARGANVLDGKWTRALDEDSLIDGKWTFRFFARGYEDELAGQEAYVPSNDVVFEYAARQIKPEGLTDGLGAPNTLSNSSTVPTPPPGGLEMPVVLRSLTVVSQPKGDSAYYENAKVPVKMRLTIDQYDEYDLLGIDAAPGDSVSDEAWMHGTLVSGASYDFTYYMVMDPAQTGWKSRTVTARLNGHARDREETESCVVRPPSAPAKVTLEDPNANIINDNMAYLYLSVRHAYFNPDVYAGDVLSIPFHVDSDGNTPIRNVTLHIIQEQHGVGVHGWSGEIKKYMKSGDSFDLWRAVKPVLSEAEPYGAYSLSMYLTGTIYNMKGKQEEIRSQTVDRSFRIHDPGKGRQEIKLTGKLEPSKGTYAVNDVVFIRLTVTNACDRDLLYTTLEAFDAPKEFGEQLEKQGKLGRLPKGESRTVTLVYTVRPEDLSAGTVGCSFIARGQLYGTSDVLKSHHATLTMNITGPDLPQQLEASAAIQSLSLYPAGKNYPMTLTVKNDAGQRVDRVRIYAVGDNRFAKEGSSTSWHDVGHGLKGWNCGGGGSIEAGQSHGFGLIMNIPESAAGGVFNPQWVVEADLADGSGTVRSNIASLRLHVGKLAETLTLNVEQYTKQPDPAGWHDGDVVTFGVSTEFTGDWAPAGVEIMAHTPGSSLPLALLQTDSATYSDTCKVKLSAKHAVDGVVTVHFGATAYKSAEGGAEIPAKPVSFTFPIAEDSEGLLTLDVKTATGSSLPDNQWYNGDHVQVKFSAVYHGAAVPQSISVSMSEGVGADAPSKQASAENGKTLSDTFDLTLDASKAVMGECVFYFQASAVIGDAPGGDAQSQTVELRFKLAPAADGPDDPDDGAADIAPDGEPEILKPLTDYTAIQQAADAIGKGAKSGDDDDDDDDDTADIAATDTPPEADNDATLTDDARDAQACKLTVHDTDSGAACEISFCAEHAAIANEVRVLLEQADDDAWQDAVALLTDALNAEYDAWAQAAADAEVVEQSRALFFARLDALRAAAETLEGDPSEAARRNIIEQLMRQTTALCEILHTG